jgi:hypothetical protein
VPDVSGLNKLQVIVIRPVEVAASLAKACSLRSICPGAQGSGHSLVIRTVTEAPFARTSTYAPQALDIS